MKVYRSEISRMSPLWWLFMAVITLVLMLPVYQGIRTVYGALTLEYSVTAESLEIRYGFDTVHIPIAQIDQVQVVQTSGGRRHAGTSMNGLKEGRWSFTETGPIRLYATRTSPLVVITVGQQQFGITPERTEEFLSVIDRRSTDTFTPAAAGTSGGLAMIFLLGVLVPFGTIGLLMYISRAGRDMTYTLGEKELEIKVGFSRIAVPYEGISGISIEEPGGFPIRTFGASMPGIYWGNFRWKEAGPSLKLYATRMRPLVLIKTAEHTYGVTPENPEEFVADVKKRRRK